MPILGCGSDMCVQFFAQAVTITAEHAHELLLVSEVETEERDERQHMSVCVCAHSVCVRRTSSSL